MPVRNRNQQNLAAEEEARQKREQAPPEPQRLAQPDQEQKRGSSSTTAEERRNFNKREREWFDFYNRRVGPVIIMILWFFMPLEKATFYAPNPEECAAIAPHMARIMPRLEDAVDRIVKLPSWAHDVAVSSDAMVQVGFITMGYLDRIGVLEKIAPVITGRFRQGTEQARESARRTSTIPDNGGGEPGENGRGEPIDLSRVWGLGEQWRPA